MTANPSRGAFLTSSWIEFCKENYASEEKNEKDFRRKWASGEITGKLAVPFSVGRAPTPQKSAREVPAVPSLPRQSHEVAVAATAAADALPMPQTERRERPYYYSNTSFFDRSLKAEAVMDKSTIDTLRLRLSKENKQKLKSKFSQSNAVTACLDFRRPETDLAPSSSAARSPRATSSSRNSPRTSRLQQRSSGMQSRSSRNSPRASRLQQRSSGMQSRSQSRQSRQSRAASVRDSSSTRSARAAPAPPVAVPVPNAATATAFSKLQLRLDERVGLPLSLQRLTLKNAFRKAQQGKAPAGRLNIDQLERVLLSLGMGHSTYSDGGRQLVAQFREGDADINFLALIASYLQFTAKSRVVNNDDSTK